jgi:drug/metabolite transporter (DMT)-like permease
MNDNQVILSREASDPGVARRRVAAAAVGALAICCLCWGFSFPVMQIATREVETATGLPVLDTGLELSIRATFNGWRFGAAAALYGLITIARQRRFTSGEIVGGVVVGLFFAGAMFLQVLGLRYTRPSASAFLTALAVVFAPIAQAVLLRRPVGVRVWAAVGLAMTGIAVLSQADASSHAVNTIAIAPPVPYLGEILTVLAALMFTGQILSLDHYGKASDPTRLTLVVLVTTGFLSLLCGALFSGELYDAHVVSRLVNSRQFWWSFWMLVVFSSVIALHLMNRWQPFVAPATAAVVYCLEPVFATLFSVGFSAERLTIATLLGGLLVLIAVLTVVPWPGRSLLSSAAQRRSRSWLPASTRSARRRRSRSPSQ